MAKKKTTTGQTLARVVMDVLKKHYAFTPDTAVRYDTFKNLRLSTPAVAYTVVSLMGTDVTTETDDDRYYSVKKNWDKVVHKVNLACVILLGLPIIILLIFLGTQVPMS